MTGLDVLLVTTVVLAAAGFLLWNFALRGRKKACHSGGSGDDDTPPVAVGSALQKGLERAQKRAG